jgi:NADPH2:quinone reductase
MLAIFAHETGGPEVLRLEEVPTPRPGPGELLVRVEAAGVNFIDIYHRTGLYAQPLPLRVGREGAGVVEAVGADVADVTVGARVAWMDAAGSYATHAIVPAARAVPVPADIDTRIAAAVMLQGLTAHYLARDTHPLSPGEVCVVHAAAGGVGLLLTQIAKRAGAHVVATVSSDEKAQLARAAGADEVVGYEAFVDAAKRPTAGLGARVVYDSVGKATFDASLAALAPRGLMVLFGASSGPVPPFDLQRLNSGGSLFITRPTLVHYTATRAELCARAADVFAWIEAGTLSVRIGATYPLAQAAEAQRALGARATTGKVLLLP